MAGSATTYFANKIIDHMLRNQAYTPPSTVYLALFSTATTDAGGGTEVAGGSYARQACALDAAAAAATQNTAEELFTNMPAITVTNWALFDASTLGNMLIHDTLVAPKVFSAGSTARVIIGALDVVVL